MILQEYFYANFYLPLVVLPAEEDGQRLDDYKYKWLKRCEGYYNEHST